MRMRVELAALERRQQHESESGDSRSMRVEIGDISMRKEHKQLRSQCIASTSDITPRLSASSAHESVQALFWDHAGSLANIHTL